MTATDRKDLAFFIELIRKSKNFNDAFSMVRKTTGVSQKTANTFSRLYNPNDNLSMESAFKKFYDEVKTSKPTNRKLL